MYCINRSLWNIECVFEHIADNKQNHVHNFFLEMEKTHEKPAFQIKESLCN